MRGYRMFPDISNVGVEWRIMGFRIRTATVLFVYAGGISGAVMFMLSAWAAVGIILMTFLLAMAWTVFVYHFDPKLTLREMTLVSLIIKAARHRYLSNETVED
ncbi:MAG: hypothetical protein E6R04_04515 [Spirochaetes bacterium]|nr:MAG: hypothetical protein E6R04_04515 [Spirochaetota bacterium]